jgi:hypothetical protein
MYRLISSIVALALSGSTAWGQSLMEPVPEKNHLQPEIINGKPAVAKDWRATLKFESSGLFCTSTIVGEKVLLTAAHCVPNKGTGVATYDNDEFEVTCDHHTHYKGPACSSAQTTAEIVGCTADVALCITRKKNNKDVLFPTKLISGEAVKYESINRDPKLMKENDQIVLLGYGCTLAGGFVSPILRFGSGTVTALSTPGASSDVSKTLQEYMIVQGGSAVCKGDSGGADFNIIGESRKVIGVTSRGNMSTVSYLTSMTDKHIFEFLEAWSKNNAEICGITAGAKNCR